MTTTSAARPTVSAAIDPPPRTAGSRSAFTAGVYGAYR